VTGQCTWWLELVGADRVGVQIRFRTNDKTTGAEHGEYSHYSVFIMFRHVAPHDLFHAYRIEELLRRKE